MEKPSIEFNWFPVGRRPSITPKPRFPKATASCWATTGISPRTVGISALCPWAIFWEKPNTFTGRPNGGRDFGPID